MDKITRQKKIIAFIQNNRKIKRRSLAEAAGFCEYNLSAAICGRRSIPEKYMDALEKELISYGFKK